MNGLSEFLYETLLENEFDDYVFEARGRNPVIDPTPTEKEIIRAIQRRKYVGFYYDEPTDLEGVLVKPGFRLVEPYVFGRGYKHVDGTVTHEDREYLRGFIIKSSKTDRNDQLKKITRRSVSLTQRRPYWRFFRVDRIHSWQEFRFTIRRARYKYRPNDKMIGNIVISMQFK